MFKRLSLPVVFGLIIIGITIGIVMTSNLGIQSRASAGQQTAFLSMPVADSNEKQQSLNAGNFNPSQVFVNVVKNVRPTIVSIYTTKKIKVNRNNNPFYHFFGDPRLMPDDESHNVEEIPQDGLGSGIIVRGDGLILTNYHVINDMDELRVKLTDNREFDAKVIGSDASTEIALIKIEAENLPTAPLGDSEKLEIGEWVIAIGNPLQLTSTVTAGIVSALSRDINLIRDRNTPNGIDDFIQTDAAINPGNSGGALVNMNGEVIGVNTAINSQTGYYMGYGFAVPINIARSVMQDFLDYGEVRRGYLGVFIEPMDAVKAKGLKLDKPRGVFIPGLADNSAAEKAGVREGDVVLAVDDKEVNQPNELQAHVGTKNPGEKVTLKIWRDGKTKEITVTLGSLDGALASSEQSNPKGATSQSNKLGMKISEANSSELESFDLRGGVKVLSVDRRSKAAAAGLNSGDIIFQVNAQTVSGIMDFRKEIDKYQSGEVVNLRVRRQASNGLMDRLVFIEMP